MSRRKTLSMTPKASSTTKSKKSKSSTTKKSSGAKKSSGTKGKKVVKKVVKKTGAKKKGSSTKGSTKSKSGLKNEDEDSEEQEELIVQNPDDAGADGTAPGGDEGNDEGDGGGGDDSGEQEGQGETLVGAMVGDDTMGPRGRNAMGKKERADWERKKHKAFIQSFDLVDTDASGSIEADELLKAHRVLHPTCELPLRQVTMALVKVLRKEAAGKHDYQNAMAEVSRRCRGYEHLTWDFRLMDSDRNGTVTVQSARTLFRTRRGSFFDEKEFQDWMTNGRASKDKERITQDELAEVLLDEPGEGMDIIRTLNGDTAPPEPALAATAVEEGAASLEAAAPATMAMPNRPRAMENPLRRRLGANITAGANSAELFPASERPKNMGRVSSLRSLKKGALSKNSSISTLKTAVSNSASATPVAA